MEWLYVAEVPIYTLLMSCKQFRFQFKPNEEVLRKLLNN